MKRRRLDNFQIICNWLKYETFLLNQLLSRNKSIHRGNAFMAWALSSQRFLKKFNTHLHKINNTHRNNSHLNNTNTPKNTSVNTENTTVNTENTGKKSVLSEGDLGYYYYKSLDSVVRTCVELSRLHKHRYFAPFTVTLMAIFSRLLLLLMNLNNYIIN
ncbi:putative integral membrane protein [Theileria parva strain Muguga]|uniref:Uncharacterized protein n=1 Tax=Theileria parva TaxID=5875 RepID=Q4MZ97_THEPA|nr:putative integral membrane protein [Theileria parva strain Muguga]EAN30833.1 putative integral membrane protein [Theileria parva strain Muguga]|eukprot:XP_763116.1 hypothetical protein [Theileria parva strain Muguga]